MGVGRFNSHIPYYYPPTGMWGVYTMSGQMLDGKFGDAGATPVLGKR